MPRSATEPGNARKWDERYEELKSFKETYGHCKVPQNEANGALGKWVKLQRKKHAQGKMPEDRVTRLESIGFAWSGNVVPRKADQWQEKFEMLNRLMSERGTEHSQALPSISKENPALATWIAEQRKAFKAGTLDDASIRKLDEIHFVWKVDPLWNRYFKALQAEVTKHGTVPAAQQALEASAANSSTTKTEPKTKQPDVVPEATVAAAVDAAKEGEESSAAPAPTPAAESSGLLTTVKNTFSPAASAEGTSDAATVTDQDTKVAAEETPIKAFYPSDSELLEWIAEQKTISNIASKTISVEQVEMLQALPGWMWEENSWTVYFVQLKGFKRKRGHCRVSTKSGGPLGQWVAHQRSLYAGIKEGSESTKPAAVADAALKPAAVPGVEGAEADDEENNLPRLQVPDIPAEGEQPEQPVNAEAEFAAGAPTPNVDGQQAMLSPEPGSAEAMVAFGNQTSLSTTQIEALNAIGFIWKPVEGHATWNDMYQQLKEYKEKHGHCMVPKRNKKVPRLAKLGVWVGKQRERYKNMLAGTTGASGQQPAAAPAPPAAAATTVDAAGDGGPKKKVFHRPPLQQEQVDRLNELGFVWEAGAKSDHAKQEWDAKLEELKKFEKQEGHVNVSAKLKGDAGQLGRWIKTQRERYHGTKKKLTPLSDEQIAQLEAVPGFSWRPSNQGSPDESWDTMFQEMTNYKEKYGDCLVPQKFGKLGGWVDRQRKRYKATQADKDGKSAVKHLSAEQIEQLNGLGFVWQAKPTPKRKYDVEAPMAVEGAADGEGESSSKKLKAESADSTIIPPPLPPQQAPVYAPGMHEHPAAHYPPHAFDPNVQGHFYQSSDV